MERKFVNVKNVGSGMIRLLNDFCEINNLKKPFNKEYGIDERISFEKWLKSLRSVSKQYLQEGLGLEIGKIIQPSHIGLSSYIASSSEDFAHFLHLANKYNKLWYNYMMREVKYTKDNVVVCWDKPPYLHDGLFLNEAAVSEDLQVSIIFNRVEHLVGEKIFFDKIELTRPRPIDVKIYENYFKCPVHFECKSTKIFYPNSILNHKFIQPDPYLIEILSKKADAILKEIELGDKSFIQVVKQTIIQSFNNGHPNIDYVSEKLNVKSHTLQQHLKNENTTFKETLNDVRFELAKKYLNDPSLNLSDITFLLSYKEQASFQRAFKNWSGVTPSEWRDKSM